MNMVMEFLRILLLMPIKGQAEDNPRAVYKDDFELWTTSASTIFRGRNNDIDFFPAPRTIKLRLP